VALVLLRDPRHVLADGGVPHRRVQDALRQLPRALQEVGLHVAAAARRVDSRPELLLEHLPRDEERVAQIRVGDDEVGAGGLGLHDERREVGGLEGVVLDEVDLHARLLEEVLLLLADGLPPSIGNFRHPPGAGAPSVGPVTVT